MTADNTHDREGAPSPATPEDRRATTADLSLIANRPIAADSRDLARLRQRFDGQVLLPDEPGYHQARQVWNAMVDRKPAVIARCASPADVAAAVGFARSHELEIGFAAAATASLGSRCRRAA